jgi:CubicO group peptidase (beta-lactamase class C family)
VTRTFAAFIVSIAVLSASVAAQSEPKSHSFSEAQIHNILVQRIDDFHQSVGIVVGIIDPTGRRVVSYGKLDTGDSRVLDGDTVFEIGSVTKVFTSLLLSDMVQRGEVALTDPVAKYLPAGTKVPQRNGKQITLLDLATHTSGLPTLPTNMQSRDEGNPYADYSVAQLDEFLSTYELPRDIGSQYEYSNVGVGLLGRALANRAGMDYGDLVRARITGPLGMSSTRIDLSADMKVRLAIGHDSTLKPVANWDLPTLQGAGALRSTANDMLTFLAANMGFKHTKLDAAMSAMLNVRRPTGYPSREIALGWHVDTTDDRENSIVWHNGGTGGYRAFIGFDPKTHIGVVVLANAETAVGVDDIGTHLLYPKAPLLEASAFAPPQEHKQIEVAPAVFQKFVGRYELAPNFVVTITEDAGHFYAQATGQGKVELFAESEKEYFLKVVDAQITFESNAAGVVTGVVLHQMGNDAPGKRLDDSGATSSRPNG